MAERLQNMFQALEARVQECIELNSRWQKANIGRNTVIDNVLADFQDCRAMHFAQCRLTGENNCAVSEEKLADIDDTVQSVHFGANYAIWYTKKEIAKRALRNTRTLARHEKRIKTLLERIRKRHETFVANMDTLPSVHCTIHDDGSVFLHYPPSSNYPDGRRVCDFQPAMMIDLSPFGHNSPTGFFSDKAAARRFIAHLKEIIKE